MVKRIGLLGGSDLQTTAADAGIQEFLPFLEGEAFYRKGVQRRHAFHRVVAFGRHGWVPSYMMDRERRFRWDRCPVKFDRWLDVGMTSYHAMSRCSFDSCLSCAVCAWCNELDARLTLLVCFVAAFSQSLLGIMFVPFPYLLLPSLGLSFTLFFVLTARTAIRDTAGYYLWFFLAQQVCSLWGFYYWFAVVHKVGGIYLCAFFFLTGLVGALTSYRLGEVLRQPLEFVSLSV